MSPYDVNKKIPQIMRMPKNREALAMVPCCGVPKVSAIGN
jgi:hypothetical protein